MKILTSQRLRGFTLLELIIAVAIIGILATVTVVNMRESRARARDANRRTSVEAYSTSMEQWKAISKDKSYFVYNTLVTGDCNASHNAGDNPLYTGTPPLYGYMSGAQLSCVGLNGGGAGRMTRKSLTGLTGGASYGATSIADALKEAGVLNAVRVDPAAENQPLELSGNYPDFVLTTCDGKGYAASNPKDATEFAIFARLERTQVTGTDVVDPKQLCGGDATKGWNTIADWGGN